MDDTIPLFQGIDYGRAFDVIEGVQCTFKDAGHILGSACLSLHLRDNGTSTGLVFTGDLGRPHLPILRDPVLAADEQTEYLITESTYGGRFHTPVTEMEEQLLQPLLRAFERKARVVIPAFSVGRTQEIVYILHKLSGAGKIPHVPVFVDSPLSVNVTAVFRNTRSASTKKRSQSSTRTRTMIRSGLTGSPTYAHLRNPKRSMTVPDRLSSLPPQGCAKQGVSSTTSPTPSATRAT